jgi:hypothetical protein
MPDLSDKDVDHRARKCLIRGTLGVASRSDKATERGVPWGGGAIESRWRKFGRTLGTSAGFRRRDFRAFRWTSRGNARETKRPIEDALLRRIVRDATPNRREFQKQKSEERYAASSSAPLSASSSTFGGAFGTVNAASGVKNESFVKEPL